MLKIIKRGRSHIHLPSRSHPETPDLAYPFRTILSHASNRIIHRRQNRPPKIWRQFERVPMAMCRNRLSMTGERRGRDNKYDTEIHGEKVIKEETQRADSRTV